MVNGKIRIGVMGCASIAKRSMLPAIKSLPGIFELVAIASRTEEKAVELAAIFDANPIMGYENLVERSDIDAIYMPLPTGLHEEWIEKCLLAGKHILVEKSLALNNDSANRMVELAMSKGLLLMENFMFKYHSQHKFTWQMIQDNFLGEVRLFRSQFGFPPLPADNFRYIKSSGGGSLLDAGAYTVKATQWFLGPELEVVSSTLYIKKDLDIDIYGNAVLINPKGVVSQISFGFDNFYLCNYEIWGSRGNLKALKAFTPKPSENPIISLDTSTKQQMLNMEADDHFRNVLKEFHRAIIEKEYSLLYSELLDQSRLLTKINTLSTKINI